MEFPPAASKAARLAGRIGRALLEGFANMGQDFFDISWPTPMPVEPAPAQEPQGLDLSDENLRRHVGQWSGEQ